MNVFHAGDGNLHPLLVFDRREPGVLERVHAAGEEIVRVAWRPAACCRASTASGMEKRDLMPLLFCAADLDAQAWLRDAFDPDGVANPHKVLPAGSGCGELQATSRSGVWVVSAMDLPTFAGGGRHRRTGRVVGGRTQWHVGGEPVGRRARGRGRRPASMDRSPTR